MYVKSQWKFKNLNYWSRKFHIHLALFLLLFIWLFSFSGLLLNHGKWKFASFWDERKEKITKSSIHDTNNLDSAAMLKNIMQQLKIAGEVSEVWMTTDSISFRVTVPGQVSTLHIDLRTGISTQKELRYNWWGKMRTLHTFNGVNKDNPDIQPNWIITRIWKFAMDGIAIGFIILCISSWIMWYKLRKTYTWGPLILISGFAIVIYFVFLLGML